MLCSSRHHLILTISSFSVKCELEKYNEQKVVMARKDGREAMKKQMIAGSNATLKRKKKKTQT